MKTDCDRIVRRDIPNEINRGICVGCGGGRGLLGLLQHRFIRGLTKNISKRGHRRLAIVEFREEFVIRFDFRFYARSADDFRWLFAGRIRQGRWTLWLYLFCTGCSLLFLLSQRYRGIHLTTWTSTPCHFLSFYQKMSLTCVCVRVLWGAWVAVGWTGECAWIISDSDSLIHKSLSRSLFEKRLSPPSFVLHYNKF